MANLYKKIHKNLTLLKNLYKILVVLSAVMFIYIVVDMLARSKKSLSFVDDDGTKTADRVIMKPKMQLEPNSEDFHLITSDKGVWDVEKDETKLYNVKVNSTLGVITSDEVNIKDDNMLMEFRGNPVFTLNLEEENNDNKEKTNEE